MSGHQSWYEINRSNPDVAEIYLHEEIGLFGVTSKDFVDELKAVRSPRLKLHLNSPGGSVDDGIAIYNALMTHPAEVEVYVDALAASIATVIAMSGNKRVMAPHSRMMIHEAMAIGIGYAGDFEKMASRLRDCTANIAGIYAERTGKPVDEWLPLMADETWFSDQEAVDAGLATEIGRDYAPENFKVAASFALLNKFHKRPEFDIETADVGLASRDEIEALRAELNARIDELSARIPAETNGKPADQAPEGDPAASLTPQEQAKAALERRLALIRL